MPLHERVSSKHTILPALSFSSPQSGNLQGLKPDAEYRVFIQQKVATKLVYI